MEAEGGERVTVKEKTPLEKYLELPEGYPAELIGGELSMTPSPSVRHQEICAEIFWEMNRVVKEKDAGKVLYEIDVHFDDENVLRPDIIFIKKENGKAIGERWIEGAPDIVVEVVSQSSAGRDMIIKRDIYEKFGVKEYWIVDPANEEVFVYESEGGKFVLSCHGKKCSSKVLEGFEWGFREKG